jgi:porin
MAGSWSEESGGVLEQTVPPPRRALLAAAVLASLTAAPVGAQQAPPAGTSNRGALADRSTLTGDWGGARDELARRGISVRSSLTQFYQGVIAGNAGRDFDYGGRADLFLDIDGARAGLWDGFSIHVLGEFNYGRTPGVVGGTTIPNSMAMSFPYENETGGDLTSVFFSQRFGSNFTLMAGKMSMVDFYARGHRFSGGRGVEGFWHTAFVAPPSGMVPLAAFGAIGVLKLDPVSVTAMVYDPTDALNGTGLEDPFSNGVTFRGSVDVSSRLFNLPRTDSFSFAISSEPGPDFASSPGLAGSLTAEQWTDLVQRLTTGALWGQRTRVPGLEEKRGRYWFGYSFEQTLWQDPGDPARAWGLFGQVGLSDGNPNSYRWEVLGGVGGASPLPGRPHDRFGAGVFYYGYSGDLKRLLEPVVTLRDEYGAEVFYNYAITPWMRMTANAQFISPAITARMDTPQIGTTTRISNPTVALLGLRLQIIF